MIQIPRGTQDILPGESYKWQIIEEKLREIAANYNYQEIRTPVFEATELFVRGVGGSTDIVNKEMYTFEDKGGRSLTLRPEGTAPVVRSYIENKMQHDVYQPIKVFYKEPMRSEEHTSELQSRGHIVCRLLHENKAQFSCID